MTKEKVREIMQSEGFRKHLAEYGLLENWDLTPDSIKEEAATVILRLSEQDGE